MDLVPTPGQVVQAAGNLARGLLGGHFADLTAMPRSLVDKGDHRSVYQYDTAADGELDGIADDRDPVLLVSPLVAPTSCYDLRRGASLVEHLLGTGRSTFVVEYGELSPDASEALSHVVRRALPTAIRAASSRSGGRPVHLVGWSLGGVAALLAAADRSLPIASLTIAGAPVDAARIPLSAPVRPLVDLPVPDSVGRAVGLLGGLSEELAPLFAPATVVRQLVDRPLAQMVNLDDADFLAQLEAVAAFQAGLRTPSRSYGRLFHRFLRDNFLVRGTLELDDGVVDVSEVGVPVLVIAGADDGIAPVDAVSAAAPLLTGSPDVRVEVVPGGHLGLLTGRQARTSTWPVLVHWLAEFDSTPSPAKVVPRKRATKKAAPPKRAAKKATPSSRAAKKATPKANPAKKSIGANPTRRYGSDNSRALLS